MQHIIYGDNYSDLVPFLLNYLHRREGAMFPFGTTFHQKPRHVDGVYQTMFYHDKTPYVLDEHNYVEDITNFCLNDDPFLWCSISGPAGSGKSRLALEAINDLPSNWFGCFIDEIDINDNMIDSFEPKTNTLIVIDYISGREERISDLLVKLYSKYIRTGYRLRTVVIDRNGANSRGGWYQTFKNVSTSYAWRDIIASNYSRSENSLSLIRLGDLTKNQVLELMGHYIIQRESNEKKINTEHLYTRFATLFTAGYRRPLFVYMFTIALVEGHINWSTYKVEDFFEWIIDREITRWKNILGNYRSAKTSIDLDVAMAAWKDIVCYFCAFGVIDLNNSGLSEATKNAWGILLAFIIEDSKKDKSYYNRIKAFLNEMLNQNDNNIYKHLISLDWPDILIEKFFLEFIDRDDKKLSVFVSEAIKCQKRFTQFIERIRKDFSDPITVKLSQGLFSEEINKSKMVFQSASKSSSSQDKTISRNLVLPSFPMPLSPDKERLAIERMLAGDLEMREKLIEHNLRLVAHVAKKYANNGWEVDDLVSIGTIGLIKAVTTFKSGRGMQLATYAARCIDNEILVYLRASRRVHNSKREVSLVESIVEDGKSAETGNLLTLSDVLADPGDLFDVVYQADRKEQIHNLLSTALSKHEREIIIHRYGLYGNEPLTQRSVAAKLGISRSYVSRIEKKALQKLQKSLDEIT